MKPDHPVIVNSIVDKTGTIFYISDTIKQYYPQMDLNRKNICMLFDRFTIELLCHSKVHFGQFWDSNLITKDKKNIPFRILYRGCIELLNGSYKKLFVLNIHKIHSDNLSININRESQFYIPKRNFENLSENDFLTQYYNEMCS